MCYYFHGKTNDGYRYSVSVLEKEDGDIYIGTSICSKKDNFSRKTGRLISEGRAKRFLEGKPCKGSIIKSFYADGPITKGEEGKCGYRKDWYKGREEQALYKLISYWNSLNKEDLMKQCHL